MLLVQRAAQGYFCLRSYTHDPWLDALRAHPTFRQVVGEVEARHREALALFLAEGGDVVLGVRVG